jgi:hypothetical protein
MTAMTRLLLATSFLLLCGSVFGAEVDVTCSNNVADTAALNGSIGQSHAGDEVRIHGNCLVNGTIVLLGNRTYAGDSRTGTTITQAKGSNLVALLASDSWNMDVTYTGSPIRIAHMTLDGNNTGNMGTNVLVIRSWLTVIEDMVVQNAPGDGIQITNLSKNGVALTTSQVNGRISNCFVNNFNGNGIHVIDTGNSVTDWDLVDSWVAGSSSSLSAIYMDNAAGWKVRGNHLYNVQQHALFANACFATAIDGNYIEDFGLSGESGTWYGIACTVQGGAASVITGNKVFMLEPEGASGKFVFIGVPTVNYGTGQLNVVDNTIRGAGTAADVGLEYELNGGAGLNVLSKDNSVEAVHVERKVGPGVKLAAEY